MTAEELSTQGFNNWLPITQNLKDSQKLILSLPKTSGVYVIKANSPVLRLKGTSDLIYIGHGKIQTRIQNLLIAFLPLSFKNYRSKHTAADELTRIVRETGLQLKISFLEYPTKESARIFESSLIQQYCRDHIEPPPLNNTRK